MGLKDELTSEVGTIFRSQWSTRDGREIPSDGSVQLGNDAVKITATVLYADLADSTKLVDDNSAVFAAEIYKTFLHCAAKIIRSEAGLITAYDGDRIMAVYAGDMKNTQAMRTALKIKWAVTNIIEPLKISVYKDRPYSLGHWVASTRATCPWRKRAYGGVNDLVWVGRAANYAAKLSALPHTHSSRVTKAVYDVAHDSVKRKGGQELWEKVACKDLSDQEIYRSNASWPFP